MYVLKVIYYIFIPKRIFDLFNKKNLQLILLIAKLSEPVRNLINLFFLSLNCNIVRTDINQTDFQRE